ncbi:hypothetical protein AAFF_G00338150 [Aldrovandia affinis]|uniref:ribonuclease H n=1 Tax=Aldrovandia affinis TaxID=143900 RepID=A0AAD7WPT5_9TELE|nr:hypothetical protein AAFF_G00338150 [Aldrovandia affinis]
MPLVDFYATHPFHNELPFDYWIRLNKAIDTAEDALKRQGKTLENLAREVTVMFIRHCPDPELALVFKCKPLEEWTAGEVQARLDECQREHRLKQRQPTRLAGGVVSPFRPTGVLHACAQTAEKPAATQPPLVPAQPTEGQSLEDVIALLEHVLEQGFSQRNDLPRRFQQIARPMPKLWKREPLHSCALSCRSSVLCLSCTWPRGCSVYSVPLTQLRTCSAEQQPSWSAGKLDGPHEEGTSGGPVKLSPVNDVDLESAYSQFCASVEDKSQVILQNTQKLSLHDNLIYTTVQGRVELKAMVDSGSIACTLSSRALSLLEKAELQYSGLEASGASPTGSPPRLLPSTSPGYYNVDEQDKKFTAFTSPFGLYEYNRLPQGLCNSLATFMRMMMSIFGDQNFLSLLCYLDDVLVSAPDEQLALQRLGMVFERLTT